MNHSTPGLPVYHQLLESTQTNVHQVDDAIQPSHPLSSPSPPALNLSQCGERGIKEWSEGAKVCFHSTRKEIFQLDQLGANYEGKESRLLDTLNNLARRQFHFFLQVTLYCFNL